MPRICFVTCRRWPEISKSDQVAQRALERRGVAVEARPWNVPGADFRGFDAVVLRSNWEYHPTPKASGPGSTASSARARESGTRPTWSAGT
jgi:hypothetical protein